MHHWTAHTHQTLSNNPVLIKLWKDVVPIHAFQHRFLLQGILALSARHKLWARHDRSADLVKLANVYQQEALSKYISLLNDVTEENCHALFAFSQVVVGLSYTRMTLNLDKEESGTAEGLISGMIEVFELLKGALAVAKKGGPWLRAGDLAPMLGDEPETQPPQTYPTCNPCIEALSSLSDRIANELDGSAESKARIDALLSTIQFLCTLFLGNDKSVDRLNQIIGLPLFMDPHYTSLLRAGDPISLVVLCYYGAALHGVCGVWSVGNMGAKVVAAASSLVGPEWSSHLSWPQMVISA